MVLNSVQCLGELYGFANNVKQINDATHIAFGDEVSSRVGQVLVRNDYGNFDGINQGIDYLKNVCGYAQGDLDSVAKFSNQVRDSLQMYGTTPEKVPFFSDKITSHLLLATDHARDYLSNVLGSISPYFGEAAHHVQSKISEVASSGGADAALILGGAMAASVFGINRILRKYGLQNIE